MKFVLSRTSAGDVGDIKVDDKKYKIIKVKRYLRWIDKYVDKLFIEINSLEELMEFQKDYGNIVITDELGGEIKEIEIYDDYRE